MNISATAAAAGYHRRSMRWERWPSRLFEAFCRCFFKRYCKLVVEGSPPRPDTAFVVCSNHASHIDSIAIMIASGLPFRSCALLAAHDYFFKNVVLLRSLATIVTLIPVNRAGSRGFRETLRLCKQRIEGGGCRLIVAFPEGTRGDGTRLRPFRRGASLLATMLHLPVVPVWISGSHEILPKGRWFPRRGTVRVAFGDVLQPPGPGAVADRRRSAAMTRDLANAVQALAPPRGSSAIPTRLTARK